MAEVVLLLNNSTPTPVILLNKLLSQGEGVPFWLLQPTLTDLVNKGVEPGQVADTYFLIPQPMCV